MIMMKRTKKNLSFKKIAPLTLVRKKEKNWDSCSRYEFEPTLCWSENEFEFDALNGSATTLVKCIKFKDISVFSVLEFQEINRRRKYIFSLFEKFGDDAEALTTHYMQFVQDNQVMKKMYVKEMEQLIWETGLYFF